MKMSQVTKVALQHLKIYIQNNKYVASYLATSFIMSSFHWGGILPYCVHVIYM